MAISGIATLLRQAPKLARNLPPVAFATKALQESNPALWEILQGPESAEDIIDRVAAQQKVRDNTHKSLANGVEAPDVGEFDAERLPWNTGHNLPIHVPDSNTGFEPTDPIDTNLGFPEQPLDSEYNTLSNPIPDIPDASIMHIGPVKPLDDSESLSLTKGRGAHVVDYDRMDDKQEKEIRDFTKDSVLKRGDQPIVLSRYGRINQDEYGGDDIISHPISEGSELGAHFSISRESYQDDIEYDSAKSIAKQHINSQRHDKVYQRFVTSIQNPYPMEDLDHWNAVEVADWILMDENIPDDLARKNFEEVRRASSDFSIEGIDDSPNLINRRFLKSLGYDSIKYFNDTEGRGDSYIIFDEYDVEALGGNPINLIE